MFEDTKINIFMAVAEEKSFTKAARKLGISQPAVSQNIADIEKSLGTTLFARSKSAVELTENGHKFVEYATQILYWYKAASDAFAPGLPEALMRGELKKRDYYIGVSDCLQCHLIPEGDEMADINIADRGGRLSIRIEQKKTDPGLESASVLF